MTAKIKNDRFMLESAVAGWKGETEDGLFSSPCWLAFHAAKYLATAHATQPVKCAMSRGYSVKIETAQGNQYLVSFTGRELQHISAKSI
mgnify:FL=1